MFQGSVYINTDACNDVAYKLGNIAWQLKDIKTKIVNNTVSLSRSCGKYYFPRSAYFVEKTSACIAKARRCIGQSVNVYETADAIISEIAWEKENDFSQCPTGKRSNIKISEHMSDEQKAERDEFIRFYEMLNADEKNAIDQFFNNSAKEGLTEDDIANIKYLAYTSEEPYHTVFFDNISNCKALTWQYSDTPYYGENKKNGEYGVHINIRSARTSDGAYRQVFHELGHQIDDNIMDWTTVEYEENGMKKGDIGYTTTTDMLDETGADVDGIYNVLYSDLRNYLSNYVRQKNELLGNIKLNDKSVEETINAMLDGRKRWTTLNPYEREIFEAMKFALESEPEFRNYGVSDIVGGLTNNTVAGMKFSFIAVGVGHERDYWYDGNKQTYNQGAEFFAHCMEYAMSGQTEKLEMIKKVFPTAVEQLETHLELGNLEFNPDTSENIVELLSSTQP